MPDPKTKKGRKLYDTLRRSLREDYINETLAQYLTSLRKRYPVVINEEAMQSVMEE